MHEIKSDIYLIMTEPISLSRAQVTIIKKILDTRKGHLYIKTIKPSTFMVEFELFDTGGKAVLINNTLDDALDDIYHNFVQNIA